MYADVSLAFEETLVRQMDVLNRDGTQCKPEGF